MFHDVLCHHPDVCWLSPLTERYPARPGINRAAMRLLDVPGLERVVRRVAYPTESYGYWESHCRGFTAPFRDLTGADVTEAHRSRLSRALAEIPVATRPRLVAKLTGWPRIGFLAEIVDDARFVHIVRDGRAVVSSLLLVDWWWGWRGPSNWRFGPLDAKRLAEFDRHDRSFVALAAIEWKTLIDAADAARASLPPETHFELRYEDLCEDPVGSFRAVAEFCELRWTARFEKTIDRMTWTSRNDKWRVQLNESQQRIVEEVLGSYLERFGYA